MADNPQKEKWAKLREIILNIIGEKGLKENPEGTPSGQETQEQKNFVGANGIRPNKKEIEKNRSLIKFPYYLMWQKFKKRIFIALITIVFLFAGFLIIFGIGLYKYHWDSERIIKITNIIPYPVVIINNKETNNYKIIKYSEFQENFKAIKLFFQKQKQADPTFQILPNEILKENTLKMIIEDYFIFETLKKNGIIIKKEEIDNKIQKIIDQTGSEEQLKKTIKNLYNWDLNKFKEKAIKQIISQEKIENLIAPKNLKEWLEEQFKKVKIYKFI